MVGIVGCTSIPTTIRSVKNNGPVADSSQGKIQNILGWLDQTSLAARNLYAEGDITVANDETSQDGNFTLRSKRLDPASTMQYTKRTDSLSVQVTGPFGISVAKFLACPDQYYFYNVLNGDALHGRTDANSLENLTQMKGITLGMLDDALYGLAPGAELTNLDDSISLLQLSDQEHILLIRRFVQNSTDAIYLHGTIPSDRVSLTTTDLAVQKFQHWNSLISNIQDKSAPPAVTIKYNSLSNQNGIQMPSEIETIAGHNRLTLQYSTVRVNSSVIVKIKIPKS